MFLKIIKKYFIFAIVFLLPLFIFTCSETPTKGSDTGKITGTVYDAVSGSAINKALVLTTPPTSAVTTDTTGAYQITNVEGGTYHVRASKAGYDSAGVDISVSAGNTTIADISLESDSVKTQ